MDLLFSPLLGLVGVEVTEVVIAMSCLLSWIFPVPLFIKAGIQDKREHEIDGWILMAIGLMTLAHCILFVNLLATLVMVLVLYLCFREKEIAIIGQADFILLAHWLFSSFCFSSGEGLMIVESVVFLVALLVYTKVYKDENGEKWHRGKMVPLFPPYTVTVCIMAIVSVPVGTLCFYWGF